MGAWSTGDPIAEGTYVLRASQEPSLLPGRQAEVVVRRHGLPEPVSVGHFGVVHPEVLRAFELTCPSSAMELKLEAFL